MQISFLLSEFVQGSSKLFIFISVDSFLFSILEVFINYFYDEISVMFSFYDAILQDRALKIKVHAYWKFIECMQAEHPY